MRLSVGDSLGPYEITGLLGKGGMGEVYRATDPRLHREVAIKVCAEQFSDRFKREARAVAALNHPNICTLYDVGPNYLVMELVDGPTLAQRIKEGPIELEEALAQARQIADALEAAHEKGITHRDLKPANIKIRPDGLVKVLDFGLAKIADPAPQPANDPDHSPTLTALATKMGAVMGTAAYMAPEQAKGKTVDKRADIWAFGVVLYEMVTGKRLFHGEDLTEILASVVKERPDLTAAPSRVRRLLGRCLDKDPKKRLRDISVAFELLDAPAESVRALPARARSLPWAVAGLLAAALLVVSAIHFRQTPPTLPVVIASILPPDKGAFNELAISPDGKLLAFTATTEGKPRLWVRPLHSAAAQPLAGTEEAYAPFWSPDSRWIGFAAQGKLKKIQAAGGLTQALCDVARFRGGTWSRDGVILYSDVRKGLFRVPAQGGEPTQVTAFDQTRLERSHRWPVFLPESRQYLYLVTSTDPNVGGVYLGTLDGKDRTRLLGNRSNAAYAAGAAGEGYLLFVRDQTLMAQAMDSSSHAISGDVFPVAEKVRVDSSDRADFSASATGALVYRSEVGGLRQLAWMDRGGKRLESVGELGNEGYAVLSPDERQVAISSAGDIWLQDLSRSIPARFTFHPRPDLLPVWSPDGKRIAFSSNRDGVLNLYQKSADGAGQEQLLLKSANPKHPTDWSPDGRLLLYGEPEPRTNMDLWVLPVAGGGKPTILLQTEFHESGGAFSPDGKWIAYTSDASGRAEVYVQPFPVTGVKWQVSKGGGGLPRWRRDGKEMFYLESDGTLMAVEVGAAGGTFRAGIPAPLFETHITDSTIPYSVSRDGKRFLLTLPVDDTSGPSPATLMQNWLAAAKR